MLLQTSIRLRGGPKHRAFETATRHPQRTQLRVLAGILHANRHTAYGREYGFSDIHNPQAFRDRVPANRFEALAPYVERMKCGEPNVLVPDRPVMFNLTSGTTTEPKYVPLTREGLRRTVARSNEWLYRALADHPSLLSGSVLCISGAAVEGLTDGGIPYGSASGMIYESLPRPLRRSFALPFHVAAIGDYDLRYDVITRMALEKNISLLVTPNPTTMLRVADRAIEHQERMVRSIHDGVLDPAPTRPISMADARVVSRLEQRLEPNPGRAAVLERVIRQYGRLLPSACWDLKLIGCWLGGSVGLHAARLDDYFGADVPKRDIGYLASEGCMTVPCEDHTPGGILALHNNYYEFLPAEATVPHAAVCESHEVEVGRHYRILLTNSNGLYRYNIHDIVNVCGFYNRTPLIAFVRKDEEMCNITGEKLHVNHALYAFSRLRDVLGVVVRQFRIVPHVAASRYELLLQLEPGQGRADLQRDVLPAIDRYLAEGNIEYAAKRASGRLKAPRLHVMDATWAERSFHDGAVACHCDTQYKWRHFAPGISATDAAHTAYTLTAGGSQHG